MEKLDSWQLVHVGAFEAALKKADIEYEQTQSIPSLRHKLFALLHLERFHEASILANLIVDLRNGETDFDYIMAGITIWIHNNREEVIELWKKGQKSRYTDAAGGVELQIILYFAAIKTNNEKLKNHAIKRLGKLLKSKSRVNWPAPLGDFILGIITEETLRSGISGIEALYERQSCQADFAVGIKMLEMEQTDAYKDKIRNAVSHLPPSYQEPMYYIAAIELKME